MCPEGSELLPFHLPIRSMTGRLAQRTSAQSNETFESHLFSLPHREAIQQLERTFDREYLERKFVEADGNITQAARLSGLIQRRSGRGGLPQDCLP